MNFVAESKGTSATRSSGAASTPSLRAKVRMPPSVGSPESTQASSLRRISASFASAATVARVARSWASSRVTASPPPSGVTSPSGA